MIRHFLLIVSLLFTGTNTYSQTVFGVKGGLNFSKIEFSDFAHARTGFHAGGFLEIPTSNENLFVQAELLLAQHGGKAYYDPNERLILTSLSLPILVKYLIKSKFYPEVGPQFNFHLSGVYNDYGDKEDVTDEIVRFDYGLAIGAGYKITDKIHANIRYYIGFNNLLDTFSPEGRNRTFQFSVGHSF